MTSHSNFRATDNDRAAVVNTVATVGDGVSDGAVATRDAYMRPLRPSFNGGDGAGNGVAVGDGHVNPAVDGALRSDDATVATDDDRAIDTVTNPDDAITATNGNAHKSSFPRKRESRTNNSAQPTEFNAVVADTVTIVRDETVVTESKNSKSSFPQEAGIQTQGQQLKSKHGRRRRTLVTTIAIARCRPWTTGSPLPAGMTATRAMDGGGGDRNG